MGFTLNKLAGVHVNQGLKAFRNANSGEKNNPMILTKMGALFSKRQPDPVQVRNKANLNFNKKPILRFPKKEKTRARATSDLTDEGSEVHDFFDEEDGNCAPIVSRISFSDDYEPKSFASDRCDDRGKGKAQVRSTWGVQKRRIISDFARALIPGAVSQEKTESKGTILNRSSKRSSTSIGSFATYEYDDLSPLNSEEQNSKFTTSPSSLSPWDTPRGTPQNSAKESSDDSDVFYDALPKSVPWLESAKRRIVSDLTWSDVTSESTEIWSPKKAGGKCKISLLSDDQFYDAQTWSWSKPCSARVSSSDSFRTATDDNVAPWFISRC